MISIHASRMGCDSMLHNDDGAISVISIHASRMGCDPVDQLAAVEGGISIHASRMGCDVTA